MSEKYDSTQDTLNHIRRVRDLLQNFCELLEERGIDHDRSKLGPNEKPYFDEVTPKLKGLTYGSDEYKESLKQIQIALDHHYANNSHHPEFYENGIDGMDLLDVVEMLCDWKAATERHEDGDIEKSLEINAKRFNISPQLKSILSNTIRNLYYNQS